MSVREEKPRHIVCAVRGRPESRQTVTYAIDLALESGARLTFLHVMDAEFLDFATVAPLSVIYQELSNMGEFAMLILVDRAQRRGVSEVDYKILEGNIRRQLLQFAIDTHADTMVLGIPKVAPGRPIFKIEDFNQFILELESEGNLRVHAVSHD